MTKYCAVYGCQITCGMKGRSFYRLPLKDPKLLDAWIQRLRTPLIPRNSNTRVCSRHWHDGKRKSFTNPPAHWNPDKIKSSRRRFCRNRKGPPSDSGEPPTDRARSRKGDIDSWVSGYCRPYCLQTHLSSVRDHALSWASCNVVRSSMV